MLRGVELEVQTGQVVALAGPNGAGKTTLLRIAATLLRPTRGEARVHGLDAVAQGDRVRRRVGFVGHSAAVYEDLTAAENLAFSFRMRGLDAGPVAVERALRMVGLESHRGTRVRRFSAGMRRRLALARVVAALPDLLLVDEPYASLDTEGVELVNALARRVVEGGGAVLMVTHDLEAGRGVTDRVLTLREGVVVEGPPTPLAAG